MISLEHWFHFLMIPYNYGFLSTSIHVLYFRLFESGTGNLETVFLCWPDIITTWCVHSFMLQRIWLYLLVLIRLLVPQQWGSCINKWYRRRGTWTCKAYQGRRCFQALLRGDDQQGLLLRLLRSLRDPRGDVEGRGEDPHLQELHVA